LATDKARGKIAITQHPTDKNDYTLAIRFDDPAPFADRQEVTVTVEY